jgi:hypothetical protein
MERDNQFSYEAKRIIFDFIEDYERDSGEQTELDVIALCCDIAEMTLNELIQAYNLEKDTTMCEAECFISDHSMLCGITEQNTFVFHQF